MVDDSSSLGIYSNGARFYDGYKGEVVDKNPSAPVLCQ